MRTGGPGAPARGGQLLLDAESPRRAWPEHLPGERVCTINGPPLAVAQAVASVCEAQVS